MAFSPKCCFCDRKVPGFFTFADRHFTADGKPICQYCLDEKSQAPHMLLRCCREGNLLAARRALSMGAKADTTGLLYAATGGHAEIVELLLHSGADANRTAGPDCETPLVGAVKSGHLRVVELLIANGADVGMGKCLHCAVRSGNLEVVTLLVAKGAEIDAEAKDYTLGLNARKDTPLLNAARLGHVDIARFLIANGADVHACTDDGITATEIALEAGHMELVKLLVANGGSAQRRSTCVLKVVAEPHAMLNGEQMSIQIKVVKGSRPPDGASFTNLRNRKTGSIVTSVSMAEIIDMQRAAGGIVAGAMDFSSYPITISARGIHNEEVEVGDLLELNADACSGTGAEPREGCAGTGKQSEQAVMEWQSPEVARPKTSAAPEASHLHTPVAKSDQISFKEATSISLFPQDRFQQYSNRVTFYGHLPKEGILADVVAYRLTKRDPRASCPNLIVLTGSVHSLVVSDQGHPELDEVFSGCFPGKDPNGDWGNMMFPEEYVANYALPGCRLESLEPFRKMETEILGGYYDVALIARTENHREPAEGPQSSGGPECNDKAIREYRMLIARAKDPKEMVPSLKILRRMYAELGQHDHVWCVAATLAYLKQADAEEFRFFEQYRSKGLPRVRSRITEENWQKQILHPDEDRYVSLVLANISQSVIAIRAREHKDYGIKRKERLDLASGQLMISRVFMYASQVLGVSLPELYLRQDWAGDMEFVSAREKQQLCPAVIVGSALLQGKQEKDLGYALGKRMSLLRPDHIMRWPRIVPQVSELKAFFLAALELVQQKVPVKSDMEQPVAERVELLRRFLPPQHTEQLAEVVRHLLDSKAEVDLQKWALAVDYTSTRAGFLLCNDLEVAIQQVLAEPVTVGSADPKEKVRDLIQWSVSEEYFEIRNQLGLAIG